MVPVKLNNQRVPSKNTRLFVDGTPLIVFILETLTKNKYIDDVYVYCSNEAIKNYLIDGVKFLKRPDYLDSDSANCNDIIRSFIKEVNAGYYVVSHTTAPFTTNKSIDECIESVIDSTEYDSSFTVQKVQTFLWQGEKPINFDLNKFPRTQDLEPIYMETSGAFVFSKETFEKYNRRVGVRPRLVEVSAMECIDIDTEHDMLVAQAIYQYNREDLKNEHSNF